ncbi:hypothetical protein POJ06DRAFT_265302 [Lipomyces tetrasporus]|uniref:Uncharacterized protein n=1 Tax=Lipomyces tetrasporus TaxID=54092 RepID=A0AAD7QZ18_9ASCO|nr:uncharacterized protein POJ06DRAFT_265302 [Lipomyces tetrasporus]KAJ8102437.1 hypothetical protein POJ06DRAFT_265302 [Lipomyces tetrasporus]
MSQKSVHVGGYDSIPDDASPGLVFLKEFIPVLDSLDENASIAPFVLPETRLIINDNVTSVDSFTTMVRVRSSKLSSFYHKVKRAWDLEVPAAAIEGRSGGRRTVFFESVSVTVFKDDPEQLPVEVPEFNIIEVEPTASDHGKFVAVELRSYLDPKPVFERRLQLQSNEKE